jgi:hypothetical protein
MTGNEPNVAAASLMESFHNSVTLDGDEWKKNDAFRRLVERQILQELQVSSLNNISLAISRIWINGYRGRFLELTDNGTPQELTERDRINGALYEILYKIVSQEAPQSDWIDRDMTPVRVSGTPHTSLQDTNEASPCNHSLQGAIDASPLPMITEDIFDDNDYHGKGPPSIPLENSASPRRVSLNMKPLEHDVTEEEFELIDFFGTVPSPPMLHESSDTQRPSKRLKTHGRHNESSTTNKTQPASPRRDKKEDPDCMIREYSSHDVLFGGSRVRDHPGNQCIMRWLATFTKTASNVQTIDDIRTTARRVSVLWKELGARFLQPKTLVSDGSTVWIELGSNVIVERLSVMIKSVLNSRGQGFDNTSLHLLSDVCEQALQRSQKLMVLKGDMETGRLYNGDDFIMVESSETLTTLGSKDVIFGLKEQGEHFGNLRFLHHMEQYIPNFERTGNFTQKLEVILQIMSSWRVKVNGCGRFFAPIGHRDAPLFSRVEQTNGLIVLLGVARMVKHLVLPVKEAVHVSKVYLGQDWTIYRDQPGNYHYCRAVFACQPLFSDISRQIKNQERRMALETEMATMVVESQTKASARFFRVVDMDKKVWMPISREESVKRTIISLRLKAFFTGAESHHFFLEGMNPRSALSLDKLDAALEQQIGVTTGAEKSTKTAELRPQEIFDCNHPLEAPKAQNAVETSSKSTPRLLSPSPTKSPGEASPKETPIDRSFGSTLPSPRTRKSPGSETTPMTNNADRIPSSEVVVGSPRRFQVNRPGAKNPVPMSTTKVLSPETNLMYESAILSPTSSPGNHSDLLVGQLIISPMSPQLKAFVRKVPSEPTKNTASDEGNEYMQPLARRPIQGTVASVPTFCTPESSLVEAPRVLPRISSSPRFSVLESIIMPPPCSRNPPGSVITHQHSGDGRITAWVPVSIQIQSRGQQRNTKEGESTEVST